MKVKWHDLLAMQNRIQLFKPRYAYAKNQLLIIKKIIYSKLQSY